MPTPKLHELGAAQAATLLARRELKSEDLVRACLERISAREDDVHAFAQLDPVSALMMLIVSGVGFLIVAYSIG